MRGVRTAHIVYHGLRFVKLAAVIIYKDGNIAVATINITTQAITVIAQPIRLIRITRPHPYF
jgi:hypothetical protein